MPISLSFLVENLRRSMDVIQEKTPELDSDFLMESKK